MGGKRGAQTKTRGPHGPRKGWTAEKLAKRERALGANPHGGYNHNTIGCEFSGLMMWDDAIAEFERAVEINPWNAVFKANAARAYFGAGKIDHAQTLIARALAQAPDSAHIHFVAAMVAEGRGDKPAAVRLYRRCLELGASIMIRRDVQENIRLLEKEGTA